MTSAARKQPLPSALRELQADVRQKILTNPSYSQFALFRFYAPFFVFLSIFALGVLLPRYANLNDAEGLSIFSILSKACSIVILGVGGGLVLLRVLIWIGVRLATSFCEMDLSDPEVEVIGEKGGEQLELTQANLIIGGLFG